MRDLVLAARHRFEEATRDAAEEVANPPVPGIADREAHEEGVAQAGIDEVDLIANAESRGSGDADDGSFPAPKLL